VDRRLVETARAMIGPDHLGGLIETGFGTDIRSLVVAPIPNPAFAGEFHRLCGSSTIARLTPGHTDLLRRDSFRVMHEHYRWIEVAGEQGAALAHLPVAGNYLINTSQNHSENYGPFARWRQDFTNAVRREGKPIDDTFLARFGLPLASVRAVSDLLSRDPTSPASDLIRGFRTSHAT
jgi:hypothetical protein